MHVGECTTCRRRIQFWCTTHRLCTLISLGGIIKTRRRVRSYFLKIPSPIQPVVQHHHDNLIGLTWVYQTPSGGPAYLRQSCPIGHSKLGTTQQRPSRTASSRPAVALKKGDSVCTFTQLGCNIEQPSLKRVRLSNQNKHNDICGRAYPSCYYF